MKRAPLLFGSTIFSGSLLLFLIQPIMAKAILPWFGGAAGVWACALFFFQAALLAGYAYAWWSARHLAPRAQAVVHLVLLAASLVLLPVAPRASWKPSGPDEPAARIEITSVPTMPGFQIDRGGSPLQIEVGMLPGDKIFYRDREKDQYLTMEELTRRILDRCLFPKLGE